MKSPAISRELLDDTPLLKSFRTFALISSTLVILIGTGVLYGWSTDSTVLKSLVPGFVAMNPATAICFILSGNVLWLLRNEPDTEQKTRIPTLVGFFIAAVVLIALVRLVGYWFRWSFGLDTILFSQKLSDNRMAPNTAFNFILVGAAFMTLDRETRNKRRPAQYLSCFLGLTGILVITGYTYNAISFTRVSQAYIPMALHTGLAFILLSLGILAIRPNRGLMAVITDLSVAGGAARSLLSTAIFLPIVLSVVCLQGQRTGLYDTEVGLGLFTMANIIIFTIVVWWNSSALYRLDKERQRADLDLKEANRKLTGRVTELHDRNLETLHLVQLGELLQTCVNVEEASQVVAGSAQKLFSGFSGALYLLNENRTLVETAAEWGGIVSPALFSPGDCLALRSGRVTVLKGEAGELQCKHLGGDGAANFVCAPMMAQGETVGLFHLRPSMTGSDNLTDSKLQLATAVSEQTGLAFSNIKLRTTLRNQAIRDPLTHLFNRRYMEEFLELELRRARRSGKNIGILMADIDYFKKFNDTLGHEAGDALLVALSRFFETRVRGYDIACRFGGEEFVLILPEATLENSKKRAEALRDEVKKLEVRYQDKPLGTITLSFGVAVFPDHGASPEALLRAADTALYRAKAEGRDRVVTQVLIKS